MKAGLTQLHVFFLTAEHKSMRKAAALLCVSPPAVTMQIRKLEEQLGLSLFRRDRGALRLTAEGAGLHERLKPMFDQLPAIESYLDELAADRSRPLMLGTHHLPGTHFIPDLITHVRARYPALNIQLTLGTQAPLMEMVLRGELDVALIIGEPPRDEGWGSVHLFDVPLALVTGLPGLFPGEEIISVRRLEGAPMILQQKGAGARTSVLRWLDGHGVQPDFFLDNLSSDVIKQLLPHMPSVSCIGRFIVREDIERGLLREIRVHEGLPCHSFHFVYRKGRHVPGRIRSFVDGIRGFVPGFATMPAQPARPEMQAPGSPLRPA
ncbi:MAG: LysR family transcriptional regulator [Desulfovibrionaceae bacterium]|nr:LysR family transcriptional regulator [Desulfovibrionaceae bacterium]